MASAPYIVCDANLYYWVEYHPPTPCLHKHQASKVDLKHHKKASNSVSVLHAPSAILRKQFLCLKEALILTYIDYMPLLRFFLVKANISSFFKGP